MAKNGRRKTAVLGETPSPPAAPRHPTARRSSGRLASVGLAEHLLPVMPDSDLIPPYRSDDLAGMFNDLDLCPNCDEDAGLYEIQNPDPSAGFSVTLHCVNCDAQRGAYG